MRELRFSGVEGLLQPEHDLSQPLFTALEHLPAAALVADSDGHYVYVNPAAASLLRKPAEEILGRSIADFVSEGFDFDDAWERFLQEGSQEGELSLLREGATLVVHFNARADFAPGRHISILTDISDRKRVEANVRRTEELYSRAFNLTPAPTNIRRLSTGVFIDVNQAFTDALGYWRSDVVGRTANTVGLWQDPGLLSGLLEELREGERVARVRATLVSKDRSSREFSVSARRVEIFGEAHAVCVYTDIATA